MMTPWRFVEALDGRDRVKEATERVRNIRYSRVPVFDKHPNKVTGIVHVRSLLEAVLDGRGDAPVSTFAHEVQFVPESAVGDDLIAHFQKNEDHFSVVVDSLGNVVGVLSLEDVLEELVGELIHEVDVEPERIKRVSKTEILVDAETEVQRINIFFNTAIPGEGRIGELLLKDFGYIPKGGEKIMYGQVECVVEKASPRRLEQIRILKHE